MDMESLRRPRDKPVQNLTNQAILRLLAANGAGRRAPERARASYAIVNIILFESKIFCRHASL